MIPLVQSRWWRPDDQHDQTEQKTSKISVDLDYVLFCLVVHQGWCLGWSEGQEAAVVEDRSIVVGSRPNTLRS